MRSKPSYFLSIEIYVVCSTYFFISGIFLFFLLFLGMVMYANEVKTNETLKYM